MAPSPIPFHEGEPTPIELDQRGIDAVVEAFTVATRRALAAGFRIIEIHMAHGYLLHSFLSPLSNRRPDEYGGPLENRIRLPLRVIEAVKAELPANSLLFVRISATDWAEGGWDLEQSVAFSREACRAGVKLIDVSSGALVPHARIPVAPNYQVPFAATIRRETGIGTGAVGMITDARQADAIIKAGEADLVFLAREMLRDPYWAIHAAQELGKEPPWPTPYGYAAQVRKR